MITNDLEIAPTNSPRFFKAFNIACGARQELCVTLVNDKGQPVDLGSMEAIQAELCKGQECEDGGIDADNPGFEDGIEPKRDWPDVCIRMKAIPGFGQPALFDVTGKILDYKAGRVVFHLTQKQTRAPGVFIAEIGLFRGDLLMTRFGVYINIEPSVFGVGYTGDGMITIPEVRLALRDTLPEDNFLLDEVEFRDVEILACMRYPVDMWNSLLPIDPTYSYSMQNFPFRYPWLRSCVGHLLEISAHWYRRNALQVNAGGVAVNDRGKFPEYQQKSKELRDEFEIWAKQAKASISMMSAFGQITSPFVYNSYGVHSNRGSVYG